MALVDDLTTIKNEATRALFLLDMQVVAQVTLDTTGRDTNGDVTFNVPQAVKDSIKTKINTRITNIQAASGRLAPLA